MTNVTPQYEPITVEILSEMFTSIAKQEEFDAQAIAEVKKLAAGGNLNKTDLVIQAVKPNPEANP